MSANKLLLSISDNEELKDALADIGPGDEVTLEVRGKLIESTDDQASFVVTSADVVQEEETPEPAPETETEGEPKESGSAGMGEIFGNG